MSRSASFCIVRATISASSSSSSPATRIALSAPIASVERSCCCTSLGPIDTTMTSPSRALPAEAFSVRRSAVSTAYSSNWLSCQLAADWSSSLPLSLTFCSGSGTRLAVTRIFTVVLLRWCVIRARSPSMNRLPSCSAARGSSILALLPGCLTSQASAISSSAPNSARAKTYGIDVRCAARRCAALRRRRRRWCARTRRTSGWQYSRMNFDDWRSSTEMTSAMSRFCSTSSRCSLTMRLSRATAVDSVVDAPRAGWR